MFNCRFCGQRIKLVKSPTGKQIPVNEGLKVYWKDPKGDTFLVTEEGNVVRCSLEWRSGEPTGCGYIPHWKTCTDPRRFRVN